MKSFQMPKKKGTKISTIRQRKLKEAKEAAEQEVNKYRQQKEAEFEKLRERVQFY